MADEYVKVRRTDLEALRGIDLCNHTHNVLVAYENLMRAIEDEAPRLRRELRGINEALKAQGLYVFEHVDGTYSICQK